MSTPEDRFDPDIKKFPLQLLTPHPKNRVHSELYLVPWLREVEAHQVWINSRDAGKRGIENGEAVKVFNDRGIVMLSAFVTQRIMPGVVAIFEGAWYAPDENGIDRGGCANTLTRDAYSGGGACVMNTSLVEITKA